MQKSTIIYTQNRNSKQLTGHLLRLVLRVSPLRQKESISDVAKLKSSLIVIEKPKASEFFIIVKKNSSTLGRPATVEKNLRVQHFKLRSKSKFYVAFVYL